MCTGIIIGADRSSFGRVFMAKNRDKECGEIRGEEMVIKDRLDYSFMGVNHKTRPDIITQGINDKGLCIGTFFVKINKPGWEEDWKPIPGADANLRKCGVLGRAILGLCANVEEAIRFVTEEIEHGRYMGGSMLLADATEGAIIEGTDSEFAVQRITKGIQVRTNHFMFLDEFGPDIYSYPSSYMRRKRVQDILAPKKKVFPKDIMEVYRDHDPDPSEYSICRHAIPENPMNHNTVSSSIMIPKNDDGVPELLNAPGNGCTHEYISHIFD